MSWRLVCWRSPRCKAGFEVTVGDVYGLAQRGGHVASHIRWQKGSPLPPLVPQGRLDVLIAFEPLEALRVLTQFGSEKCSAIVNDRPILPIGAEQGRFTYPQLPELCLGLTELTREFHILAATSIAQDLGSFRSMNMVMMGALFGSGLIRLEAESFEAALRSWLSAKQIAINLEAFRVGMRSIQAQ